MTDSTKSNLSRRAAAWYTAAYRRLDHAETYTDWSVGSICEAWCLAEADRHGAAYDRRAAIAARYARLASR